MVPYRKRFRPAGFRTDDPITLACALRDVKRAHVVSVRIFKPNGALRRHLFFPIFSGSDTDGRFSCEKRRAQKQDSHNRTCFFHCIPPKIAFIHIAIKRSVYRFPLFQYFLSHFFKMTDSMQPHSPETRTPTSRAGFAERAIPL